MICGSMVVLVDNYLRDHHFSMSALIDEIDVNSYK